MLHKKYLLSDCILKSFKKLIQVIFTIGEKHTGPQSNLAISEENRSCSWLPIKIPGTQQRNLEVTYQRNNFGNE